MWITFTEKKKSKDGYDFSCKDCKRERTRLWALEHPEHKKETLKNWKINNKQKFTETQRKYKLNNPEKLKTWRTNYKKNSRDKKIKEKIKGIKEQNCICPGCGHDFSTCSDKALLICFEKSHIHNKKCSLRNDNEFFWSCRDCNGASGQWKKCGYWTTPNNFNRICEGLIL